MRLCRPMDDLIQVRVAREENGLPQARNDAFGLSARYGNSSSVPGGSLMIPRKLMTFWRKHREECRPVGAIVDGARADKLAGVAPLPSSFGYAVKDEAAALAAMQKEAPR